MGSGNSRLHTRFEEFKKRRNVQATLSKKQLLLKDSPDHEEDEEDQDLRTSHSSNETEKEDNNNNNNKVIVMKKEIQVQPIIKEATVVQVTRTTTITTIEKLSRIVPISISECEIITEEKEKESIKNNLEYVKKDIDSKLVEDESVKDNIQHVKKDIDSKVVDDSEEIVKPEKNEEEVSAKGDDNDNDNDNDNDSDDEEYGRLLCPGSPSFRIYFIEAEKRKEEEEEEDDEEEVEEKCESSSIVVHQKSHSADSTTSASIRHSRRIPNEVHGDVEMESRTKRKGKGMKKFGPVRTLMKVKSCYYPMFTCTGDERSRVVAAKSH